MELFGKIAGRIVSQYSGHIDFGLSIIDTNGIVLASTDNSLVGSFHELAYTLALSKKTRPFKIIDNTDYLGASTGVCMLLHYNGSIAGSFAMMGEPEALLPLAQLMATAIETVIAYESQIQLPQTKSLRDSFMHNLVYGSDTRPGDMELWAGHLGFDVELPRFPMLISSHNSSMNTKLLQYLRGSLSQQDIIASTRDDQIIIFKACINSREDILGCFREQARLQYRAITEQFSDRSFSCCVGPFLHHLSGYSYGCQCCFWLRLNYSSKDGLLFFYDHLQEYLYSRVPAGEMMRIMSPLIRSFDKKSIDDLGRIVGALDGNNYNLVRTSAELFMHKNTLSAALERLRDKTGADPMHSAPDRKLLWAMAYNLSHSDSSHINIMENSKWAK